MSADEGLLCHCDDDKAGHPLGDGLACPKLTRTSVGFPEIHTIGEYNHVNLARVDARGTCPVCHKPGVRVKRVQVFSSYHLGRRQEPEINPRVQRGNALEIRPGMAPHKIKGVECAGTGQVPAETRYTPGRELAGYLQLLREEEKTA